MSRRFTSAAALNFYLKEQGICALIKNVSAAPQLLFRVRVAEPHKRRVTELLNNSNAFVQAFESINQISGYQAR